MDQKNGWKQCVTLGCRAKPFCWKFIENQSLHIKRQFENAVHKEQKEIANEQLHKIQDYVQKHPGVGLANNVENLRLGTEKEGLGKFLYEHFGWSTTDAQLASHIAALFVEAGVWKKTREEAKRSLQFKAMAGDKCWQARLDGFYRGSPDCDKDYL